MHVVLMADAETSVRETAMISRLAVALTGEGVRVTCAVPVSVMARVSGGEGEAFSLAARMVAYRDAGLPFTRRWRAAELAREVMDGEGVAGEPPDVLHVIGFDTWALARECATALGACLMLDVYNFEQAREAARVVMATPTSAVLAADRAIAESMSGGPGGDRVALAPWGVHAPHESEGAGASRGRAAQERSPRTRAAARTLVVSGAGRSSHATGTLLQGVRRALVDHPDAMVFADAPTAGASGFYSQAQRLGLTDRVTVIPDAELHRHVVVHADGFVIPEHPEQHRTLVLEVMAAGLPVLVPMGPRSTGALRGLSYLRPGETCRGIEAQTPEAWSSAIREVLVDDQRLARIGLAGRAHVRDHHTASAHASAVIRAYEAAVGRVAATLNGSKDARRLGDVGGGR